MKPGYGDRLFSLGYSIFNILESVIYCYKPVCLIWKKKKFWLLSQKKKRRKKRERKKRRREGRKEGGRGGRGGKGGEGTEGGRKETWQQTYYPSCQQLAEAK